MSATNVGVVGTGSWAKSHIEAWRRIPGVKVTHLLGRDPIRTRNRASEWKVPHSDSLAAETIRAGELDVLDVVTAGEYRIAAVHLANRLNIPKLILEKPVALSRAELGEIRQHATDSLVEISVNHQKRFLPGIAFVMDAVGHGRIGSPAIVSATCRGTLYNQGNHVLDLIGQVVPLDQVELESVTPSFEDGAAGADIYFSHPSVRLHMAIGPSGRWIGPGGHGDQVGIDILGTGGMASGGINNTAVCLSVSTGEVSTRETSWERDKIDAERHFLEFALRAGADSKKDALSRATRVSELLFDVEEMLVTNENA